MIQELPAVVVKIGGSLLDLKDLAARLRGLFSMLEPSPAAVAWVVGGGPAADLVRHWETLHGLSDEAAHWMAIRAMRLTEKLLQEKLPECVVVSERKRFRQAMADSRHVLLSIEPLLEEAAEDGEIIPGPSWEVTSDTLAAWAAKRVGARRVVLAKSVDAPAGGLEAAAREGLVDPVLPRASEGLELSWVNLRSDPLELVSFHGKIGGR